MRVYYDNLIQRLIDTGLTKDTAVYLFLQALEDLVLFNEFDDQPEETLVA